MPSQDSLSRRLGPVFAEVAAKAQPLMTMEQHKAEYRSRPLDERLGVVASPAKAYKPTHGGYPRMTHDDAYLIVIPMACWHQAANDDHCGPLRAA